MRRRLGRFLLGIWLGCIGLAFCATATTGEPPAAEDPTAPFSAATTQFDFARGLLARNLHAESVAEFTAFLTSYPEDPRVGLAHLWRGEANFAQGRFKNASIDFYTVLTRHRDLKDQLSFARLRYGCSLFELKLYPQAVSTLEPLTRREGVNASLLQTARYYLGLSYAAQDQAALALAELEKVKDGALAPNALYERAEVQASLGKHVEAADIFAAFRAKFSKHARADAAMIRRGEELRLAGRLDDAAESYLALLQNPTHATITAQAQYGLAWVRYTQANYTATRDLAQKVLQGAGPVPTDNVRYLLGLARLRLEDYVGAQKAFAGVAGGQYASAAATKLAWAHLAAGNGTAALKAVEACLQAYPNAPRAELDYVAGKAFLLGNDHVRAIERFEAARKAKGAYHAESALELANVHARPVSNEDASMTDPQQAAEAYGYFIETFPRHPRVAEALVQQGSALMQQRLWVRAVPVYAMVISRENVPPSLHEHALEQQAVCYYHLKQFANMKRAYEQLLEKYPKGSGAPEALYWLAWYEHQEKRFALAAGLYARILKEFDTSPLASRARYRRAMCLYQDGQEAEAASALHEIVTRYPQITLDQKELLWLGQYYMNNAEFDKSDTVYEALLRAKPDREARALAFYYQAESRRRREDWEGALKRYERLLAEEETGLDSLAHFGRAMCLRRMGKLPEAREALGKVEFTPDDPMVAHYLAEIGHLDFAEKRYTNAAAQLMRVGLLYDDEFLCGEALLVAGQASLKAGDREKARTCFRELAGEIEGGYGTRYPKSRFTQLGRDALARLDAPAPDTAGEN